MAAKPMPNIQDLEKEALVGTSILQQRASDVRNNEVNWQSYLQAQMISQEVYNFLKTYDNKEATPETRAALINQNPMNFAAIFRSLIDKIAKDQTLQYILTMLDDALQEDQSRVEILREFAQKRKELVWQPFFLLLERSDLFIVYQSSRIIAKIACWSKDGMEPRSLQNYLGWLKDQLKQANNEYNITVARCLQMMLRVDSYRHTFVEIEGMDVLASVLTNYEKIGFQLTYQLIFCLWCLSFNPALLERMNKLNLVHDLTEVFASSQRDKVKRIVLALFRNMLEKAEDKAVVQEYALAMIRSKLLRHMELLNASSLIDPDVNDDVNWITEKLETSVQDLSSFDEYVSEVRSGNLDWSPVHRSDRFWGENATRLNNNNYELLRQLVHILETSPNTTVQSIAAHDIGEYIRHYPRGKQVIEQLGGKHRIMEYVTHTDSALRYQCLLALQKMMVHNWEYVSKKAMEDKGGVVMMEMKS